MIRVSVLYPNSQGASFDMEYYLKTHLPMVRKTLGESRGIRRGLRCPR
jgi:hypothetical protein